MKSALIIELWESKSKIEKEEIPYLGLVLYNKKLWYETMGDETGAPIWTLLKKSNQNDKETTNTHNNHIMLRDKRKPKNSGHQCRMQGFFNTGAERNKQCTLQNVKIRLKWEKGASNSCYLQPPGKPTIRFLCKDHIKKIEIIDKSCIIYQNSLGYLKCVKKVPGIKNSFQEKALSLETLFGISNWTLIASNRYGKKEYWIVGFHLHWWNTMLYLYQLDLDSCKLTELDHQDLKLNKDEVIRDIETDGHVVAVATASNIWKVTLF